MSEQKVEKGRREQAEEKGRGQIGRLAVNLARAIGHATHAQIARFYSSGGFPLSEEAIRKWSEGKVESLSDASFKNVLGKLSENIGRRPYVTAVTHADSHTVLRIHMEKCSDPSEIHHELSAGLAAHNKKHVQQKYLYYDPTGARRWLEVIGSRSYSQMQWVHCAEDFVNEWRSHSAHGDLLKVQDLEVISLGTGDGAKEERFLTCVRDLRSEGERTTTFMLVEISVSLLCSSAVLLGQFQRSIDGFELTPWCADFEEGPMGFAQDLPSTRTALSSSRRRLVMILGNTFANVQHESEFVGRLKRSLVRSGDLLWLELAEGCERIEEDPFFDVLKDYPKSPRANHQAMTSREELVIGSYLRHAGMGNSHAGFPELQLALIQTQEHCEVQESYNFVYTISPSSSEPRAIKMLFTRRYREPSLVKWFRDRGFNTLLTKKVASADGRQRVMHLLLQRV